ncbi:Vacuolar calcium ion transporter [Daldinia childiae]|uniref:Vacuolar calcium ion transporter n=1 Tax=Daldinia childiae TaxID=326645 RepID=UPI001445193A|nr:Vacuolar calcium ion transporter [Daldinia childiae]KAF3069641.1 Vacuolar calcium ion transporter [Daldinia childiae]
MKESSTDKASNIDRIRSWARGHAYGGSTRSTASNSNPILPINNTHTQQDPEKIRHVSGTGSDGHQGLSNGSAKSQDAPNFGTDTQNADRPAPSTSQVEGTGSVVDEDGTKKKKQNVVVETYHELKKVILHSWINLFLVFVPVGIAIANIPNRNAGATFGINAVAIIPLAALLSHATESVARKMGDTVGALLNVTFGNAVELIIFIALVKGEIRIVQASLLGSILANLLLILGMAFFLGGLRFREQIYNSTVTQMSACLLSLSVISLMLPTAFHASFRDKTEADNESLKISHGVSVILLLVYVVYLLFQLKSHAYMYESTPQHIIDEEATPGPAAAWLESSDSDSSSSSDSDSDHSGHSRETMSKRVKRAIRGHRRRKSSTASVDTDDGDRTRTSSLGTNSASPIHEGGSKSGDSLQGPLSFPRMNSTGTEEAIEEEDENKSRRKHKRSKRKHRKRDRKASTGVEGITQPQNIAGVGPDAVQDRVASNGEPRRVDFADTVANVESELEVTPTGPRRPFNNLRVLSFRPVAKSLAPPVFTSDVGAAPAASVGPVPRVRYGIRRTNSLPERLNQYQYRPPGAMMPSQIPISVLTGGTGEEGKEHGDDLSRGAAIIMLLLSTALVAVCAEFMVDAIDDVVANSALKETFIGLIILPIVGNAAEHVTAVTVAMKNKMDLAIGVAIGSSIQISLFLTPLVVIIGWIIGQPMTLYFTLFETVCLFVSAFIINFLILDGRSNYLEGALLCATYVIIAVVAFFYPEGDAAGTLGA